MLKSPFVKKPMFGAKGKKFAEPGAEYVHRVKDVRKHRTGGRPGGKHRPTAY